MTDDRLGRPVSSSVDPDQAQRVEALVDEAVAQAAKGSYGEAATRAEQALAIDPDNAAARDLLLSYRRLAADDDERRRRRRSIAAAAATIEEMIEDGRLDEATSVTEALTLQYGQEAPVEELRARIAEARGDDLDFAEMDAAIAAIRQPDRPSPASPPQRLDAVGTLAAEIEDHLRSGRLEEAGGRLEKLARMPGSEDRLEKLRSRIEDARHVADEHRREEEILIATAAIEERIRRGSIDDAATRLAELDARHGASAPIAELRQQIQEARALETEAIAAATPKHSTERTAELLGVHDDASITAPLLMTDDEPERGPARWLAIAAVVALVAGGGGWWIYRQSTRGPAAPSIAGANEIPAAGATDGALNAAPGAGDPLPTGDDVVAPESPGGAEAVAPDRAAPLAAANEGANDRDAKLATAPPVEVAANAAPAPPTSPSSSTATDADRASAADAASIRPAEPAVIPPVEPAAEASRSAEEARQAAEPPAPPDAAPVDTPPQSGSDVVVETLRVNEPPPAPAAPAEAPPAEPAVSDPPAPSPAGASAAQNTPAEAPADARPAVAERVGESAAAPAARAASGPVVLGCGAPDVVCVKALQVPTPAYPAPARNRRLTANVVVMALVDERGRVIDTRVESSGTFRFFDDAAVDAAKRSVFQPASRAGVPGRSWVRLTFKFDPR